MPGFSNRSLVRLGECHLDIQKLFTEVVLGFDCSIIEGHRPEEKQDEMFELGRSKLKWPKSKHNKEISNAVDSAPYPIDWEDRERFLYFGGYVLGVAFKMNIGLRWGGDWDRDTQVKDNRFDDLVHFELYFN